MVAVAAAWSGMGELHVTAEVPLSMGELHVTAEVPLSLNVSLSLNASLSLNSVVAVPWQGGG
jgi:hypothetical protein